MASSLSYKGDPSYFAMGSPSCAKQTPVRANLDPTPGPGSASFIEGQAEPVKKGKRGRSQEAPNSTVPTGPWHWMSQ